MSLMRNGDALERAVRQIALRGLARLVIGLEDDGVQRRIVPLDPRDGFFEQFGRRNLALAHEMGEAEAIVPVIFREAHGVPPDLCVSVAAHSPHRQRETALKAYLAGPDVFLPDAVAVGRAKQAICARHGFEGLFPLDNVLPPATSPRETALAIARANEDLIRKCDVVFANLTPFRSPSADPGTAFEIGFARALGKRVHGYSAGEGVLLHRTQRFYGLGEGAARDPSGHAIEDFGMVDNLMLDGAIIESGGVMMLFPAGDLSAMSAFEALLEKIAG